MSEGEYLRHKGALVSEGEYLRHKGTLVPLYLPTSYHCFTFFAMIFITKFCRFGVGSVYL